jgi:SAM-dependent methyltransferase
MASQLLSALDVAIPPLSPGDLLEVGVASGNYLLAMQRSGWRVSGIELDPTAAATAARRTGASVRNGDLLSIGLAPESFDLICGWMVFEHLHDPVAALTRSFEWLRPGGWIAFSVPDAGSWQFAAFRDTWFALQLPTHLYHFSRATLRKILTSGGYDNVSIRSQRTLFDVAMSWAYQLEDRAPMFTGAGQGLARSTPVRALARAAGMVAGPLGLTGRLTVWAQRPYAR